MFTVNKSEPLWPPYLLSHFLCIYLSIKIATIAIKYVYNRFYGQGLFSHVDTEKVKAVMEKAPSTYREMLYDSVLTLKKSLFNLIFEPYIASILKENLNPKPSPGSYPNR